MEFKPRQADTTVNVSRRHPLADAATLIAGVGGLIVMLVVAFVLLSDKIVARISVETEMRWFGGLSATPFDSDPRYDEEADAARDLLMRLAGHWGSEVDFRLSVIDDPLPNAFAVPGGQIVVTRGLIDSVKSENELAFVLAHELGHFHNRDHLRQIGRGAAVALILGVFNTGSTFGFNVADLTLRRFGREQESDADAFALALVQAEYGHIGESTRFFRRIETRYGPGSQVVSYLETHPLPGNRAEQLEALARERNWQTAGPLTPWPFPANHPQD